MDTHEGEKDMSGRKSKNFSEDQTLWHLMREAWTALQPHYEPVIARIVNESGLESRAWGLMLAALTFEPDKTTPGHLMVRGPYNSAESYLNRLRNITRSGYLAEIDEGAFSLTTDGRAWLERFVKEVREKMAEVDPLPESNGGRLADLVKGLADRCLNAPSPPQKWSIRLSYKIMPPNIPPLPYIEQAISCLSAYRDDAHLAAWQETGLSATALEVLTYLWRGEARSFEDLIQQLAHRGHTRQVYMDAVAELRGRHFVTGEDAALEVTREGRAFRDLVEENTDGYFYFPWTDLDSGQRSEMVDLLVRLRDELQQSDEGREAV